MKGKSVFLDFCLFTTYIMYEISLNLSHNTTVLCTVTTVQYIIGLQKIFGEVGGGEYKLPYTFYNI